jgi:hypothetical protein
MRTWILGIPALILSTGVGFLGSFALTGFIMAAMNPVGLNLVKTDDSFRRVYVEMARLREAEMGLSLCAKDQANSTRQPLLRAEAELIESLRTDAKSSNLAPPLDVAQAILSVRSNTPTPQSQSRTDAGEDPRVAELLVRSGWTRGTTGLLRDALVKIDGNCK